MTCFHCRDQQAVPWCTGRRLVAKGALGVVTGAENRDLFGTLWMESGTSIGARSNGGQEQPRGRKGDFCLLHTTQCSKKKKRKW